jgi:hypothetical protein
MHGIDGLNSLQPFCRKDCLNEMTNRLLFFAFLGFTSASLFYLKFGGLTWKNYWSITSISLCIFLIAISVKAFINRSAK